MPYHEPEGDDPHELLALAVPALGTETWRLQAECFAEELLRTGYDPEQVLAIFKDPFYAGAHQALTHLGEDSVRAAIEQVAAALGCPTPGFEV
jgi:hypothetical protein